MNYDPNGGGIPVAPDFLPLTPEQRAALAADQYARLAAAEHSVSMSRAAIGGGTHSTSLPPAMLTIADRPHEELIAQVRSNLDMQEAVASGLGVATKFVIAGVAFLVLAVVVYALIRWLNRPKTQQPARPASRR